MQQRQRLSLALLGLRLGVFTVMLMWTLDKFFNPGHSAKVFTHFYGLHGWDALALKVVGAAQLLLILAFVLGLFKRWSYGLVLLIHAVSTFASYQQYLDPFNNLLFFAAWPMLAACLALYLLRNDDTWLNLSR